VALCFVAEWGLAGLWWGLVAGNLCNVVMCCAVWYRIDWPKEAVKARERAMAKKSGGGGGATTSSSSNSSSGGGDDNSDGDGKKP
jgi:uncharacterized membrane protein YgcG